MFCSLAYAAVRLLLEILIVRGHSNASLGTEVIALRHQLRVLVHQGARPRCDPMAAGPVERRDRLGGLLHECRCAA